MVAGSIPDRATDLGKENAKASFPFAYARYRTRGVINNSRIDSHVRIISWSNGGTIIQFCSDGPC